MNIKILLSSLVSIALCVPAAGFAEEEKKLDADDLFGGGGGYFHPYVTTAGAYDDNVYRTSSDETSDYAMVLSPGIWLAYPGTKENALNFATSTLTPGGLGVIQDRGESFQRMQGFLHYGADITRYQDTDDNDTDDQRLDGLFQFNLKSGLSFEVMDIYQDDHDSRGEGVSGELDTYKSNLAGGRVTYDMGTRFRLRGEYGHYSVDYDAGENRQRDRDDDKYAAYLYYKLTGKSTIFTEYDFVDINYDAQADLDAQEHYFWGGFRWRHSEKTMGEIKAGYLSKDYAAEGAGTNGDFVVSGWLDYELTGKSRIKLLASRLAEEPDNYGSQSVLTNEGSVIFIHNLTTKLSISAEGGYGKSSYDGVYSYKGESGERDDDEYTAGLSLDYRIQDWLGVGAQYEYFNRDSSFAGLSYTDNRIILSLLLTM